MDRHRRSDREVPCALDLHAEHLDRDVQRQRPDRGHLIVDQVSTLLDTLGKALLEGRAPTRRLTRPYVYGSSHRFS